MKSVIFGLTICCLTAVVSGESVKVEAMQTTGAWTLDVVFEQPRAITLRLPGDSEDTRYWYIIVSLTNKTGKDVGFYPDCELMTDTYQITRAGAGVRNEVYERIKELYRDRYPFLESLEKAIGKLPQGADHTKDVVIVWKDFDKDARGVKFFVAGLSNDTEAVQKPGADGSAEKVLLRKTLELSYSISGEPALRTQESLAYKGRKWVMR